jgi:hypothetical protein
MNFAIILACFTRSNLLVSLLCAVFMCSPIIAYCNQSCMEKDLASTLPSNTVRLPITCQKIIRKSDAISLVIKVMSINHIRHHGEFTSKCRTLICLRGRMINIKPRFQNTEYRSSHYKTLSLSGASYINIYGVTGKLREHAAKTKQKHSSQNESIHNNTYIH